MPETVAGLFRNRSEAEEGLRKLKEARFTDDEVSIATARTARRGHYGMKVLIGIAAGAVVGAVVGAIVTGILPGFHAMVPGNKLALFALTFVAGVAAGGVAGALLSMAASGDTTLYYEEEVESGRVLVSVSGPRLVEAREILLAAGAMEAAPVEAPLQGRRPRPQSG
jgi:hypothetical protein